MEQRIVRLEEKLAHLERHVEQLDGVVREAFARIEAQQRRLLALEGEQRRRRSADEPGDAESVIE